MNSTVTFHSNFHKVGEFHTTFGHPRHTKVQINALFDEKLMELRLALIDEEVRELKEAIIKKDLAKVVDALSDINYVVYGFGHVIGVDLDKAFSIVHESNMTKACKTEDEAEVSIVNYANNPEFRNVQVGSRMEGDYFVLYRMDNGKILKSINFEEPKFDSILE